MLSDDEDAPRIRKEDWDSNEMVPKNEKVFNKWLSSKAKRCERKAAKSELKSQVFRKV